MADKILFVDDEGPILDGYKRILHREFDVYTAIGGDQGLITIQNEGPFAVVVSDMRMPGMNGAQFLAHVRHISPDSVRMLLTGYSDINAAMDAVNEGHIFRFLTKPCEKDALAKAITMGLVQYRLVRSEKDLLENTLMGSIKVLTDVLAAASPAAFGRSMRIAHYVRHLASKFHLPAPWRFEAAAMLSQLGCVTLSSELIQAAYIDDGLSLEDQSRFARHPDAARDLLVNIPRLEPIAWMIGQQLAKESPKVAPSIAGTAPETLVFGARMLRLAVALDDLRTKGLSEDEAIARLQSRRDEFGADLVDSLAGLKPERVRMGVRKLPTSKLATGMILQQEIKNRHGVLVVANGQEVTHALLIKLENLARAGTIDKEVSAMVPLEEVQ